MAAPEYKPRMCSADLPPQDPQRPRPTAISWTGGKDSNLALVKSSRDSGLDVRCLVCFHPPGGPGKFRAHPDRFQRAQAEALGLPLEFAEINVANSGGDYHRAYANAISSLHEGPHRIEVLVTGDMALLGKQTRNFVDEACDHTEVDCILPLWGADRAAILTELRDEGIRPFFTCVKSPWFDASWIGQELTASKLSTVGNGLDLCGELGEYHTVVLDSPLFAAGRLEWDRLPQAEELKDQEGQREQWWVMHGEVGLRLVKKETRVPTEDRTCGSATAACAEGI